MKNTQFLSAFCVLPNVSLYGNVWMEYFKSQTFFDFLAFYSNRSISSPLHLFPSNVVFSLLNSVFNYTNLYYKVEMNHFNILFSACGHYRRLRYKYETTIGKMGTNDFGSWTKNSLDLNSERNSALLSQQLWNFNANVSFPRIILGMSGTGLGIFPLSNGTINITSCYIIGLHFSTWKFPFWIKHSGEQAVYFCTANPD